MIVITNDDGYRSNGIKILYKAASMVFGEDNVAVVAPDKIQSLSGMGFTLHKPLRLSNIVYDDMPCTVVSGTPADCVFISEFYLFKNKIDLVLSGINTGMNVGAESVYGSGTISAAVFAALDKINAVAFSKNISHSIDPLSVGRDIDTVFPRLVYMLQKLKGMPFPKDIDLLNVNFPLNTRKTTSIRITTMQRQMFDNRVIKRKDPRGRAYYWLNGKPKRKLQNGSDAETLYRGNITVSPVRVYPVMENGLEELRKIFK